MYIIQSSKRKFEQEEMKVVAKSDVYAFQFLKTLLQWGIIENRHVE
jgi:hypothetical protein